MIKEASLFFFSRPNVTYTFQALSEEDRKLWMDAMDGKEPVSNLTHFNDIRMVAFITFLSFIELCVIIGIFQTCPRLGSSARSEDMTLVETGFTFVSKCIAALEDRGDTINCLTS